MAFESNTAHRAAETQLAVKSKTRPQTHGATNRPSCPCAVVMGRRDESLMLLYSHSRLNLASHLRQRL
jgi:hypothetical protein